LKGRFLCPTKTGGQQKSAGDGGMPFNVDVA
jgi:hypothetical protein